METMDSRIRTAKRVFVYTEDAGSDIINHLINVFAESLKKPKHDAEELEGISRRIVTESIQYIQRLLLTSDYQEAHKMSLLVQHFLTQAMKAKDCRLGNKDVTFEMIVES